MDQTCDSGRSEEYMMDKEHVNNIRVEKPCVAHRHTSGMTSPPSFTPCSPLEIKEPTPNTSCTGVLSVHTHTHTMLLHSHTHRLTRRAGRAE